MRTPALILVLCSALSICGCGRGESRSQPGPDVVRAVVLPYLTNAAFYIAAEEEYFSERDLEVEFVRLARVQDLMTALARGEVDVAVGFLGVNVMNSMARGERVRLVAALGEMVPDVCTFNAFVARQELIDSGALQDPERMRGLRVDADVLMPLGYWLDELLRPLDLTFDDLDVVNLPSPAAVEALINGTIDLGNEAEPYLNVVAASEEVGIWRETNKIVPGYPYSVMMYSSGLLDDRPEVGARFATAMLEAVRQFRTGKTPRNLALVEAFTDLGPEQAAAACWPTGQDDARIDASALLGYQEWAVSRGYMQRVLREDELVDHRFIDAANAELAR